MHTTKPVRRTILLPQPGLLIKLLIFLAAAVGLRPYPALAAPPIQEGGPPVAAILAPAGGDALQGVVAITGVTDVAGFRSAEIAFAYQNDPTGTWFLIQQMGQPVKEGSLASWDTTTITDGDYRLRLLVFLEGGGTQESLVSGLRVRNYTRIETSTPQVGERAAAKPTFTASPLPDFVVTPRLITPAPTNPAEVSAAAVGGSVLRGVLAVFGALAFVLVYSGARALFSRR